jgi:hypothetical protein
MIVNYFPVDGVFSCLLFGANQRAAVGNPIPHQGQGKDENDVIPATESLISGDGDGPSSVVACGSVLVLLA